MTKKRPESTARTKSRTKFANRLTKEDRGIYIIKLIGQLGLI